MPRPNQIRQQIQNLADELIASGLCLEANPPVLREGRRGIERIGFANDARSGRAMRKYMDYEQTYQALATSRIFNMALRDGALIQMQYEFQNRRIARHRLAFNPAPYAPEEYPEEDVAEDASFRSRFDFTAISDRTVVPVPFRFDFDEPNAIDLEHPKSHLTLGQSEFCRIPVSAPLTPMQFMDFVLRNFYPSALRPAADGMATPSVSFPASITERERAVLHMQVPTR